MEIVKIKNKSKKKFFEESDNLIAVIRDSEFGFKTFYNNITFPSQYLHFSKDYILKAKIQKAIIPC